MTPRETIRFALEDAINWQLGLLDAHKHMPEDPYVKEIKETLAAYRKLLKRRYPSRPDPFAGCVTVGLDELRKMAPNGGKFGVKDKDND